MGFTDRVRNALADIGEPEWMHRIGHGLFGAGGKVAVAAGAGALPLTATFIDKTTGGAETLTLAEPDIGQFLIVHLAVDGGDATVEFTSSQYHTDATLANVGDTVCAQFIIDQDGDRSWLAIGSKHNTPTSPVVWS